MAREQEAFMIDPENQKYSYKELFVTYASNAVGHGGEGTSCLTGCLTTS